MSEDVSSVTKAAGSREHSHNLDDQQEYSSGATEPSDDESDLQTFDRYWPIPDTSSSKFIASNGSKTVSAYTFNNAGTRFCAGSYDYEVRVWDFGLVDAQCPTPMCQVQPSGQTIIKNLDYTNDDEHILVISGGCQAAIIAKDGTMKKDNQCAKGDQYLSDMTNTKGHVSMLNDGCWHPKDRETFMTSSYDCTIRLWDVNKLSQQKTVIKVRSQKTGQKAVPNACKFSRDGLSIIAGSNDGTLLMWDTRRKFATTSAVVRNVHADRSDIIGLDYSYSQSKLVSLSEQGTCKLYDLRQLRQPLATKSGFYSLYPLVDCSFSPDDKTIMTGVCGSTSEQPGKLVFLDSANLETKYEIKSPDGSGVIRSRWHPKINHIGYTTSSGCLVMLYSDKASVGGLVGVSRRLLAASGANKRKKYVSQRDRSTDIKISQIITPHSLPLFREDQKSRKAARLSYRPEIPIEGASQGGRVKPAGSTLSSYIAQNIAKPKDDGGVGIRERILRHAEEAEKNPLWVKESQGSSGKSAPSSDSLSKAKEPASSKDDIEKQH